MHFNVRFNYMIKHSKELYGLIGYALGHSFSEIFFNQKFESEIIDEFGSDFFSDLQGIISSGSSENTSLR